MGTMKVFCYTELFDVIYSWKFFKKFTKAKNIISKWFLGNSKLYVTRVFVLIYSRNIF